MSQMADNAENDCERGDYKTKLDKVSSQTQSPPQEDQKPRLVEKVSEYVPAVGKMLGTGGRDEKAAEPPKKDLSGPPDRPVHDKQIEEFIKDQHLSKKIMGVDEPTPR